MRCAQYNHSPGPDTCQDADEGALVSAEAALSRSVKHLAVPGNVLGVWLLLHALVLQGGNTIED